MVFSELGGFTYFSEVGCAHGILLPFTPVNLLPEHTPFVRRVDLALNQATMETLVTLGLKEPASWQQASHPHIFLVDHWVSLGATSPDTMKIHQAHYLSVKIHETSVPTFIALARFGYGLYPPVLDPFTDLKAAETVAKSPDQDYCCGQAKLQTQFWGGFPRNSPILH